MEQKPNLFENATSELTQDAFIFWLISWANYSKHQALQQCSKSFISLLYNLKYGQQASMPDDIGNVLFIKRQFDYIDVYFQAEIKNKRVSFIIENKVNTSFHSDQLRRYVKQIQKNQLEQEELVPIYFKTGYLYNKDYEATALDAETGERYHLLDYTAMYEFLRAFPIKNEIYQDYLHYIGEAFYFRYPRIFSELYDSNCLAHFKYDFAQYDFLKTLDATFTDRLHSQKINRSNNPNGDPFTMLRIVKFNDVIAENCHETIYYRLGKQGGGSKSKYYLSIRQHAYIKGKYAKLKDPEQARRIKMERFQKYKQLFDLMDLPKLSIQFSKARKFRHIGNDSEIAVIHFDRQVNTIQAVLKEFHLVHLAFIEQIKMHYDESGQFKTGDEL